MADDNYDDVKCANCDSYLSFSPVFVKNDGHSICGDCNKGKEQLSIRNLTYEALAKRLKFPCRFKSSGCDKQHSWEEAKRHEEECEYRNYNCLTKDCQWIGNLFSIRQHYEDNHPKFLLNLPSQMQPNFTVSEDSKYLTSFLNHFFVLHVSYSVSTSVLSYYTCLLGKLDDAQFFEYVLDITADKGIINLKKSVKPITELFSSEKDNVIEIYLNSLLSMGLITKYEDCTFSFSIKSKNNDCNSCKAKLTSVIFFENNSYCDACFDKNSHKPNISIKCKSCIYESIELNLAKHEYWFCLKEKPCRKCPTIPRTYSYPTYKDGWFTHYINNHILEKNIFKTNTFSFSKMIANDKEKKVFLTYNAVFLVKFKFCEILQTFSCNVTSNLAKNKTEHFECSFLLSNPYTGYLCKVKSMVPNLLSNQCDWEGTETNDVKNSYVWYNYNKQLEKLYTVKITITKK